MKTSPPSRPRTEIVVTTWRRSTSNLSITAEVKASIMETDEDRPATTSAAKNRTPKTAPPGSRLIAWG